MSSELSGSSHESSSQKPSLSIEKIMHCQQVLFDGYIRTELLSTIPDELLVAKDVISLCSHFYVLNITKLMEAHVKEDERSNDIVQNGVDADALERLSKDLINNKEYFIAYKILKMLSDRVMSEYHSQLIAKLQHAVFHQLLARLLSHWNAKQDVDIQNECIQEFEQALKSSESDSLYRSFADALHEFKRYRLAIEQYQKAINSINWSKGKKHRLNFKMAVDCHRIGNCYQELNDEENQKKFHEQAEPYYQKAIELSPINSRYFHNYGKLLKGMERYKEAIEIFNKAIISDKSMLNSMKFKSRSMLNAAKCHIALQDYASAEVVYQKLIDEDPSNDTHYNHYLYGIVLKKNNNFEAALDKFKISLRYQPNSGKYALKCAICYEKLGDYQAANEFYLKAVHINGSNGDNVECMAAYAKFLRYIMNDCEQAMLYCHKAGEIDSKDVASHYQLAKLYRDYRKDYIEAEKYYLKCLEFDYSGFLINGSYGYLLYLLGDYEKALKFVQIELKIDDMNKWTHYYHALIHKIKGNVEESEIALLNAVRLVEKGNRKRILSVLALKKESKKDDNEMHQRFENMVLLKLNSQNDTDCQLI